jgi:hypothetical protein
VAAVRLAERSLPTTLEGGLLMQMLSEDEHERAWDLWFDLAQSTNDADPPYSHGVFTGLGPDRTSGHVPLGR